MLSPHQIQSSNVWVDDYSHRQAQIQRNTHRNYIPPQSSMPYQRQNPNQYDIYTNQVKSLLPDYRSNNEQNTNTIPILQRLFQAQQRQQLNYFIYLF